jgi:peptidoglycan hydrolase-like protein with peptidoglycan-binding domain
VRELQQDLQRLGYYRWAIDGLYGPRTAAAVRALQADLGLAPSIDQASARVEARTALGIAQAIEQRTGIRLTLETTAALDEVTVTADRPPGINIGGIHLSPRLLLGGSVVIVALGAMTYRMRMEGARSNPAAGNVYKRKKSNYPSAPKAWEDISRQSGLETGEVRSIENTNTHYRWRAT